MKILILFSFVAAMCDVAISVHEMTFDNFFEEVSKIQKGNFVVSRQNFVSLLNSLYVLASPTDLEEIPQKPPILETFEVQAAFIKRLTNVAGIKNSVRILMYLHDAMIPSTITATELANYKIEIRSPVDDSDDSRMRFLHNFFADNIRKKCPRWIDNIIATRPPLLIFGLADFEGKFNVEPSSIWPARLKFYFDGKKAKYISAIILNFDAYYAEDDSHTVVEIPYDTELSDKSASLVLIIPKLLNELPKLEQQLKGKTFNDFQEPRRPISLCLPAFEILTIFDVHDIFKKAFGLGIMFGEGNNSNTESDIRIKPSHVIHGAAIRVPKIKQSFKEKWIKPIKSPNADKDRIKINADKPFIAQLFVNGYEVFRARVTDPSKTTE